jgi:uncharacterized protein YndB with AHSA1/START domain
MGNEAFEKITVETIIRAPIEQVWRCWTEPTHIQQWNHASEDWHTTYVENVAQPGQKFCWRMEAKDGSFGFDFTGTYQFVKTNEMIQYLLDDGRHVEIVFQAGTDQVTVTETFEAENMNSLELQQQGWQAILNSFKKHVENCK